MHDTVMLAVLTDGIILLTYVVWKHKAMPKEYLPSRKIVRCQNQGWMSTDLMKDWLNIIQIRRPGVLLRKRRMLVLDAFKGHLTPAVKNTAKKMNIDLVVLSRRMTSKRPM